ncbi:UNVERIFIED_CONTAM: hypothetical protein FKN15_056796, partial [Acipenser sinensis]
IQNYPGEELLLVFDRNFKYEQSFYLVGTEDTKERILHHRYKISRKSREFGAPVKFTDHNASVVRDGYIERTSYPDKSFSVTKVEMDTGIQAVPQLQETSTQTKWKYPRNACTQYLPREFTDEEKENFMNSQSLKDFIYSFLSLKPGFEDKNVKKTPIVLYCAVSSIEHGHNAPISDVQWLPDYYEVRSRSVWKKARLRCRNVLIRKGNNVAVADSRDSCTHLPRGHA